MKYFGIEKTQETIDLLYVDVDIHMTNGTVLTTAVKDFIIGNNLTTAESQLDKMVFSKTTVFRVNLDDESEVIYTASGVSFAETKAYYLEGEAVISETNLILFGKKFRISREITEKAVKPKPNLKVLK